MIARCPASVFRSLACAECFHEHEAGDFCDELDCECKEGAKDGAERPCGNLIQVGDAQDEIVRCACGQFYRVVLEPITEEEAQ